jgi:hypothetical protein
MNDNVLHNINTTATYQANRKLASPDGETEVVSDLISAAIGFVLFISASSRRHRTGSFAR